MCVCMCVCQREEHTEFFSVTLSNASLDREVQLKEENGGPSDATVLPTDHSRSVARSVPSSTNMLQLRELSRVGSACLRAAAVGALVHGSRTHARPRAETANQREWRACRCQTAEVPRAAAGARTALRVRQVARRIEPTCGPLVSGSLLFSLSHSPTTTTHAPWSPRRCRGTRREIITAPPEGRTVRPDPRTTTPIRTAPVRPFSRDSTCRLASAR